MPIDAYTLLMLVAMIALVYFMMIRPENKRKKEAEAMRNSLKKGDQITSIVGKIVMVGEETIVIETSDDRVRMELKKWSISSNDSNPPAGKKGKKAEEEKPAIEEGSDSESK